MSEPTITVDGIGKAYRIGLADTKYRTFREAIAGAVKAPFRRLQKLRERTTGDDIFWALKDVSFEVQQGEVLGIIGRNGAGKSTLLKILSRITEPTEGTARLRGRVASLLEVGTGFHPELSGRENICLNGAILGMRKAEIDRKFDEIVAFSGIEKFIDTPVKRYSSGMYVRLAFAVAAHLEPEILLVDEVLAVGDVAFQRKCMGKMREVAEGGRTVVLVSHNLHAVRKFCDKSILIDEGRIQTQGPTDRTIEHYLGAGRKDFATCVELPPGKPGASMIAKRLRFCDEAGSPRAEFCLREPWHIVVEFELLTAVRHVIAAVGLRTITGVPVVTLWSHPRDLAEGFYYADFEIHIPLRTCYLTFAVGLSTFERAIYYVDGVGQVRISEVALGDQPFRVWGGGLLLIESRPDIMPVRSN